MCESAGYRQLLTSCTWFWLPYGKDYIQEGYLTQPKATKSQRDPGPMAGPGSMGGPHTHAADLWNLQKLQGASSFYSMPPLPFTEKAYHI